MKRRSDPPFLFNELYTNKMYFTRTPAWLKFLYRDRVWDMGNDRAVYLTFDDGPINEVTPWVLESLEAYGARATFFCIGKNAEQHPDLIQRIRKAGHTIGNHTWSHLKGTDMSTSDYLTDVFRTDPSLDIHPSTDPDKLLFRPPYGRMTRAQANALKDRYRIVMWDVLSGDFDDQISNERCTQNVLRNIRPGSIVVFHDSLKAEVRLRAALPKTLEFLKAEGFSMNAL